MNAIDCPSVVDVLYYELMRTGKKPLAAAVVPEDLKNVTR